MATNRKLLAAPLRVLVAICEVSVVGIGRLLSVIEEELDEHGRLSVILAARFYTVSGVMEQAGEHRAIWRALMLDADY